jgi:hypothetical protein
MNKGDRGTGTSHGLTLTNPSIELLEKNGKIIFLHKLQEASSAEFRETGIECIIRELVALNPDDMTPTEALTVVQRWKNVLEPPPGKRPPG